MSETLFIPGAGRQQVPVITAALGLGLEVVCIDRNPEAPGLELADEYETIDVTDIASAVSYAKNERVDGVLPTSDISLPTVGAINDELGLAGISPETAQIATTKSVYRDHLRDNGVPYPESRVVTSISEARRAAREVKYPIILKPSRSYGGARGVVRVNHRDELDDKFTFAKEETNDQAVLLEKFLHGEEHTVECLVIEGTTRVLAIGDKIRSTNPYCVASEIKYPSSLPNHTMERIREIAKTAVEAIGMNNGAAHIEVISTGSDLALIDFGARGGGGGLIPSKIVPHVSGTKMVHSMIELALGKKPTHPEIGDQNGAIWGFLTPSPGMVVAIEGADDIKSNDYVTFLSIDVSQGDVVPVLKTQLNRVGQYIVVGESKEQAQRRSTEVKRQVNINTVPTN